MAGLPRMLEFGHFLLLQIESNLSVVKIFQWKSQSDSEKTERDEENELHGCMSDFLTSPIKCGPLIFPGRAYQSKNHGDPAGVVSVDVEL